MLYSSWLLIAAVASVLMALGIYRFFKDWRKSDPIDIILLFFGGLLSFIAALNAVALDFECTGGSFCVNGLQTYTGEYYFIYLFYPAGLIGFGLAIVACIIVLGTVFSRRTRGYYPE